MTDMTLENVKMFDLEWKFDQIIYRAKYILAGIERSTKEDTKFRSTDHLNRLDDTAVLILDYTKQVIKSEKDRKAFAKMEAKYIAIFEVRRDKVFNICP